MKILSITAQKPHSTGSGVYLTELVRAWDRAGHEQFVVAGIAPDDAVSFPDSVGFDAVYYDSKEMPFHICGMSDEMPYPSTRYSDMTDTMVSQFKKAFLDKIRARIDDFDPDLIVCHHLYLLTAFVREAFPNKKIIGFCHGSDLRQIAKNPLRREFIQKEIKTLDAVFTLNNHLKDEIVRIFGFDPQNVNVVGAGYNHEIFRDEKIVEHEGISLLYAGKLSEAKGVFSLVRALDLLPYKDDEVVLTLAGNAGSDEVMDSLVNLAGKSRFRIDFAGYLSQIELAHYMNRSDVFILPSFYEGFALVVIEAMACGCKAVCTDIPGIKEYYDLKLPGHDIEFVPMPSIMRNIDEPAAESLPAFEENLAKAIVVSVNKPKQNPDVSVFSWDGIARALLSF